MTVPTSAGGAVSRVQLSIIAAVICVYAALSYYSDSAPNASGLATGLSLAPVLLIGAFLVRRWMHWLVATSILVIACGLLYHYWGFLESHYSWSNLAQQCGAYGFVAFGFVRSLSVGQVPLCAQLAEKLHGALLPAEITYMRRATVAWALFYLLLTWAILVLFLSSPARIWSLFVNFGTFGLIGLMFFAEHAIRRRVIPRSRHGGTLAALRQFLGE